MTYSLKNVKTFRGMEGTGFNATLYRDGVRIGTVDDAGQGGCLDYGFSDGTSIWHAGTGGEAARLQAYCAALPWHPQAIIAWDEQKREVESYPQTPDSFICELFDAHMHERDLTRLLKKIVMKVPGDPVGSFRTYPASFKPTPENVEVAAKANPGALILNNMSFVQALHVYRGGAT